MPLFRVVWEVFYVHTYTVLGLPKWSADVFDVFGCLLRHTYGGLQMADAVSFQH